MICDFIKSIQDQFRERISSQGLKYSNLYDFLQAKLKDNNIPGISNTNQENKQVSEKEFREALNHLEDDGVINLIGHNSAPTIRFIIWLKFK